jgi:type IV secretion system protein VirB3
MEQVERTPVHRSLVRPVLLGGAERLPAIINGTGAIALGLGPGLHWPNILLGVFLGTAVHAVLRWAARRDSQMFQIYLRHIAYQVCYGAFSDSDAAPAPVRRAVEPYRGY